MGLACVVAVVAALALLDLGCCQNLPEGDTCNLGDGKGGVCRYLKNCEWAKIMIRNGKHPNTCSYDKLHPIVCCSEVNIPVKEGKATRMCREYGKFVYEKIPVLTIVNRPEYTYVNRSRCGFGITTITDNRSGPAEFPHMALIGYGGANDISWLCGGSLISPRFVLTAGHCLKKISQGEPLWVRVGEHNTLKADKAHVQDLAIVEKIAHPEYKPPSRYNDIALLKLEQDVKINDYVRPSCLHTEDKLGGNTALATGWGLTDWTNANGSDVMMNVFLDLYPSQECVNTIQSDIRRFPHGINGETMLCAGERSAYKNTCAIDSGGPLHYILDDPYCMHSIIGVASFGSSVCGAANFSAIYTRVSHFVPWIESVVWADV